MQDLQQNKKPTQYNMVDLIKLLLAIYIITEHTGLLQGIGGVTRYIAVEVITRATVVFFLLAASFFLFGHFNFSQKESLQTQNAYMKKYLYRIVNLYLFWSVPYSIIFFINSVNQNGFSFSLVAHFLVNLFVNGTFYHMWFFPTLIFGVIAVYFMMRYTSIKWILLLSAVLYILCMLGNGYYFIGCKIPVISGFYNIYFKYFNDTINGFFYGIPLVAVGAWLARAKIPHRPWLYGGLCLVSVILFAVEGCLLPVGGKHAYIMVIPVGLFAFLFALQVRLKDSVVFYYARKASIVVYTAHPLFIILWNKIADMVGIPVNIYYNIVSYVFTLGSTLVFSGVLIVLSKRRSFKWLKRLY